ncbi:hypothetical protein ACIOGX_19480 [Streptomyces sp. NPDC088147]|uniref:hypothetical protein n=1 Tax=Streptomyces sp. NPDC088147 TaxID=3365830 RepID=UPI0037FAF0B0
MASLLVGVLIAAAVVIVTPVLDRHSDDPSAPATGNGTDLDLERRIAGFATDTVADARFLPPNRVERETVAAGVGLYLDGKRGEAERRLAEVDFGVHILRDTVRGRRYAEIADRAREGARGWGRIYIDLDAPARFSVQVPHPVADAYSETLGVGVLRGASGGVLVVAGAHRTAGEGNAADVAHRTDTVFHAVCAELVARGLGGIQVHGFADKTARAHDAVVSTGAGDDGRPQAVTLARALTDDGFRVCRAWSAKCPLAGRANKQGRLAADDGVPFIHVEFSRTVREDTDRGRRVVAAMTTAVAEWKTTAGKAAGGKATAGG